MKVKFLRDKKFSNDGVNIIEGKKGLEYELEDDMGESFIKEGFANLVIEKQVIKQPVIEQKALTPKLENKAIIPTEENKEKSFKKDVAKIATLKKEKKKKKRGRPSKK